MSDAMNPYQPAHVEPRHRRRSLVIVVSAAVGSILAIVVLSVVVRPSRSAPASDTELAPAAPLIDTSSTTSVLGLSPTTVPAVSRPGSATCRAIVYRVERGHDHELVSGARYLFPRGDGRWFVMATELGRECRPAELPSSTCATTPRRRGPLRVGFPDGPPPTRVSCSMTT